MAKEKLSNAGLKLEGILQIYIVLRQYILMTRTTQSFDR